MGKTRARQPLSARAASFILAAFLGVASPSTAQADEFYVETAGVHSRSEAQELLESALAHGISARVVRRFRKGQGWEYVVRVEGLVDRKAASEVGSLLSRYTGATVSTYLLAGKDVLPVDEVSVGPSGAQTHPAPESAPQEAGNTLSAPKLQEQAGDPIQGAELLAEVLRAHGGESASAFLEGVPSVHFRFERQVWADDSSLRVWHDYWLHQGSMRLEIRILEGEGKDSVTVLRKGEGAWIRVDGNLSTPDSAAVVEALDTFHPSRVLGKALDLGRISPTSKALYVGKEEQGNRTLARLAVGKADESTTLVLGVDEADHRVREVVVSTATGDIGWRYSDYHEMEGGVVVPFLVELTREGTPKERISVLELSSGVRPDDAVFSVEQLKSKK